MKISPASILAGLPQYSSVTHYWIAYSGGLDSHVLLHTLSQARNALAPATLAAVHVNHGLSPNANQWAEHCRRQCESLHIPLHLLAVDARAKDGESPEAAARAGRYEALAALMRPGDCLLTAHHQDDQAETLLLQLLRGAGPKGLAAMPLSSSFAAGWHARPLLHQRRDDLAQYAQEHRLTWIDDESNFDTGFDRNFIRHDIVPLLKARFPAAAETLSRSAALCAEAADLLAQSAAADITLVQEEGASLSVSGLQALGEVRARNLLHHWIHERGLPMPNAAHLQRLWQDVVCSSPDSEPRVAWPGAEARRYRDRLFVDRPLMPIDADVCLRWEASCPLTIAGLGVLSLDPVQGRGIRASLLQGGTIEVRLRQGGEQLQPAGREGHHALKKLFQEVGIPPWRRERIPLLYLDAELIAVAGLWVAQEAACGAEEPGLLPVWSERDD